MALANRIMMEEEQYQCMFCNRGIPPGDLDPCALNLVAHVDKPHHLQKEQTFYCHFDCLRSRSEIRPGNFYIAEPDFATIGEIEAERSAN